MHQSPRWRPAPRRGPPPPPGDFSRAADAEVYFDDPFHSANLRASLRWGDAAEHSTTIAVSPLPAPPQTQRRIIAVPSDDAPTCGLNVSAVSKASLPESHPAERVRDVLSRLDALISEEEASVHPAPQATTAPVTYSAEDSDEGDVLSDEEVLRRLAALTRDVNDAKALVMEMKQRANSKPLRATRIFSPPQDTRTAAAAKKSSSAVAQQQADSHDEVQSRLQRLAEIVLDQQTVVERQSQQLREFAARQLQLVERVTQLERMQLRDTSTATHEGNSECRTPAPQQRDQPRLVEEIVASPGELASAASHSRATDDDSGVAVPDSYAAATNPNESHTVPLNGHGVSANNKLLPQLAVRYAGHLP